MDNESIVKYIVDQYKRELIKNKIFPNFNQDLMFYDSLSNNASHDSRSEQLILIVETCYYSLPEDKRKILRYDYFYNNYSFWWEDYFERRKYLRLKREAVDDFVNKLRRINFINKKGEINNEIFE